jgi:hypothetical protein
MRILWTLVKVIVGLAVAIPLGVIALALTLGVLGTLIGVAVLALKLACVALVGYGAFRVLRLALGRSSTPRPTHVSALPTPDPYYRDAMRELDAELGPSAR